MTLSLLTARLPNFQSFVEAVPLMLLLLAGAEEY